MTDIYRALAEDRCRRWEYDKSLSPAEFERRVTWELNTANLRADVDCVRAAVLADLKASQPDHLIELREDGWTIQHSMACRLEGRLFDCPYNQAALRLDQRDDTGRFVAHLDDGIMELGEEVTDDAE